MVLARNESLSCIDIVSKNTINLQSYNNDQKSLNDGILTLINISFTYNNDINLLNDGGLTYYNDIKLVILVTHTTNYEQNLVIIEAFTLIDGGLTLIFGD